MLLSSSSLLDAHSDGSVKDEPTSATNNASNTSSKLASSGGTGNSDLNPSSNELGYNGALNNSLLYGLPPGIPRNLYSNNPTSLSGGLQSASDDATTMARLSAAAAGLGGMSAAWSPFSMGNNAGGPGAGVGGFGATGFPGASFPGLFGSPLGFHPLDFSAMRGLQHSSLSNVNANMNEMDLKGLDPRAVLSAYMSDLANARNAAAANANASAQEQVPSTLADQHLNSQQQQHSIQQQQHHNLAPHQHQPTNQELSFALSQQAERFKAAAAMYGQRFFPYGMRSFLPDAQKSAVSGSGSSLRCSPHSDHPKERERASNGTLAVNNSNCRSTLVDTPSPAGSSRGSRDSLSPSPLNSNNNSNISGNGTAKNGTEGRGSRPVSSSGSRGSGAGRSPGPACVPELKNIERMVEGLHSHSHSHSHSNDQHIFVPTSVPSVAS